MLERAHHERSDISVAGVLVFGAALIVAIVAVHVAALAVFLFFNGGEGNRSAASTGIEINQGGRQSPAPPLQTNPRQDLLDFRARGSPPEQLRWIGRTRERSAFPSRGHEKMTVERGLPPGHRRRADDRRRALSIAPRRVWSFVLFVSIVSSWPHSRSAAPRSPSGRSRGLRPRAAPECRRSTAWTARPFGRPVPHEQGARSG